MPTTISEIHAVPRTELAHRGNELKSLPGYIPISDLTNGEFRLHLLYKELNAIERLYPETKNVTQRAKKMIDDAIAQGLHSGGHVVANVGALHDPMLQTVAKNIYYWKDSYSPTMERFSTRENVANVGAPLIPARTCIVPIPTRDIDTGEIIPPNYGPYNTCMAQKEFETLANQHLEKASPYLLYNFLSDVISPNSAPNVVSVKYVMQVGGFEGIRTTGRVWSATSMKEWVNLGIKLSNAAQGAGMVTPKETIQTLIANQNQPGVQARIGVAIIPIIAAIVAAITAITALINAINQSNRQNDEAAIRLAQLRASGLGTNNFAPDTRDWLDSIIDPDGTGGGSSNMLLLGGAALAAILLLNDK